MSTMDKVLRGVPSTLTHVFYDVSGDPVSADGDVSVVLLNPDGTAFDTETAVNPATGTYTYALAGQTSLTRFKLTWSGTFAGLARSEVAYAEVVGQHLFTEAEARAFRNAKLADATKYPDALLVDAREEITEFFERYCGVSFVPRFERIVLDGSGRETMWLPTSRLLTVLTAEVDGTALTPATDLEVYGSGRVVRPGGTFPVDERNVVFEYEHGWERPPGRVVRAALVYLQQLLIDQGLLDRTVSHTDETGTYRLSVPDEAHKRPTGVPFVDSILNEYTEAWGIE